MTCIAISLLFIISCIKSQPCIYSDIGNLLVIQQHVVDFRSILDIDNVTYVPFRTSLLIAHPESIELAGGLTISPSNGTLSIVSQNGLGIDTADDYQSLDIDKAEQLILTFHNIGTDFVSFTFSGSCCGGDMKFVVSYCDHHSSQIITSIASIHSYSTSPMVNITHDNTSSPIQNITLETIGDCDCVRVGKISYNSLSVSLNPTPNPSESPTTKNPTSNPSETPTKNPTLQPSESPITKHPTSNPSENPTKNPTLKPSESPTTQNPTLQPSKSPITKNPTMKRDQQTEYIAFDEDGQSGTNDNGLVVGVVFGIIIVLILMVIIVFYYYKWKKNDYGNNNKVAVGADVEIMATSKQPGQSDVGKDELHGHTKGKEFIYREMAPSSPLDEHIPINASTTQANTVQVEGERVGENNSNDKYYDVKQWFNNMVRLEQDNEVYFDLLIENGFDQLRIIKTMTDQDMRDIGIHKLGHRKRINEAIQNIRI